MISNPQYAIVTAPAVPVRKSANHRHEMTNQLLFGEAVQILKQKDELWLKVKSLYDGYIGWITHHHLTVVDDSSAFQPCHLLAPQFINEIVFNGIKMQIPLASSLSQLQHRRGLIGSSSYTFNNQPINTQHISNKQETLQKNVIKWLNAPYLWGGKTIFGVDCSGFSQTHYKLIGVPIARDAWQQAEQGKTVTSLNKCQPGDLAFFEENDQITHVGILLNNKEIIHAAGKVRIDPIDLKGITNWETGKRTHHLNTIKRFL